MHGMPFTWTISRKMYSRGGRRCGHLFEILNNMICANAISPKIQIGEGSVLSITEWVVLCIPGLS